MVSTGEALVKHSDVRQDCLHGFDGSGPRIAKQQRKPQKLSLELGGNLLSLFLKTPIWIAPWRGWSTIWFNQGRFVALVRRLLMQRASRKTYRKIQPHEHFANGPPLDKSHRHWRPSLPRVQLERIQRLVDQGIAEGATCWQPSIPLPRRGLYFSATC